jgi:hypothetical protein
LRRAAKGICSRHGGKATQLLEYRAADLIERQSAQIERMRAALQQARVVIAVDRESFLQCAAGPDPLDQDDQGIVDEYDGLIRQIDEAMGGNDASE